MLCDRSMGAYRTHSSAGFVTGDEQHRKVPLCRVSFICTVTGRTSLLRSFCRCYCAFNHRLIDKRVARNPDGRKLQTPEEMCDVVFSLSASGEMNGVITFWGPYTKQNKVEVAEHHAALNHSSVSNSTKLMEAKKIIRNQLFERE